MHDFLALTGALAFALLPGAVLVRWTTSRKDHFETLGTACAVSLGINSFAILLLYLAGAYNPATAWAWAVLLGIGSAGLAWRGWRLPLPPNGLEPSTSDDCLIKGLPLLLLPLFAIIFYKAAFLPFFSYDAIASWNRWARDLVLIPEEMHHSRFFYPLYNSFGISFPYMLSGDTTREYFSHLLSFTHLLVLYAGLRQLGRALGFSAGVVLTGLFLSQVLFGYAGTGYADVASTGFGLWSIALYLQALQGHRREGAAWLAGLAGATGYLFKQSILPLLVLTPILCLFPVAAGGLAWRFRLAVRVAVGLCMAPLFWNLIGGAPFGGAAFQHVIRGIHGDRSKWQILGQGWELLISTPTFYKSEIADWLMLLFVCLLLAAGLWLGGRLKVAVGAAALVNLVIWMGTANYDVRGAMLALATLGAVSGSGLDELLRRLLRNYRRLGLLLLQALLLAGVLYGEYLSAYPPSRASSLDWRPGSPWLLTSPWQDQDEKRAVLDSDLRDLLAWKRSHPGFRGRFFSDAKMISAIATDQATPAPQPWLNLIQGDGRPLKPGDYIFVHRSVMDHPKTGIESQVDSLTWREWLDQLARQGMIREEGDYANHYSFEVVALPPKEGR